ncbi:MAG: nickel-type superoxide dismutase maturation protease [Chloroflexi bacterium]|nr:MAG: nickel-type superoxide dismutase maturation protease [Chloroflexota bacterium]TME48233.1 MAG: nickel-type superoxide dismutase maturation protease [Chloroflexota bacterium]
MQPGLRAGALVIARPVDAATNLQPGDVVVARRPDRPGLEVIKRIHSIDSAGTIFLLGDNSGASSDSREFGAVTREQIVARVRWRYWPLPLRRV